ncbi:MAG: hypothetical protein J6D29_09055 [Solobacterium sp.]|nr:hypothetical protein [Solobacterium sp.]
MITEEFLGGQNSIAYSASDFTLLNGATFNGSQNQVKVYLPSKLVYIFFDITVPTIESNTWMNFVEFPVVTDTQYYSASVMSYPTASGSAINRLARIVPNASEGKSTYGFYAYTGDSNKRFAFSFTCIAR